MYLNSGMSTAISSIEYDAKTATLVLIFVKGGSYTYKNVPPKVVEALKDASSQGHYFNTHIRKQY